jgi:hypothetical protein
MTLSLKIDNEISKKTPKKVFVAIFKTHDVLQNFNCFPIFDDFRKNYFFVKSKFRFFSKTENSNGSTLNLILLEYRNFFGRPGQSL